MLRREISREAEEITVADWSLLHDGEVGPRAGEQLRNQRVEFLDITLEAPVGVKRFWRSFGRVELDGRAGKRIQIIDVVRREREPRPDRGRGPTLAKFQHGQSRGSFAADGFARHERIDLASFETSVVIEIPGCEVRVHNVREVRGRRRDGCASARERTRPNDTGPTFIRRDS